MFVTRGVSHICHQGRVTCLLPGACHMFVTRDVSHVCHQGCVTCLSPGTCDLLLCELHVHCAGCSILGHLASLQPCASNDPGLALSQLTCLAASGTMTVCDNWDHAVLIMVYLFLVIFSSPTHKVLMVSYCDQICCHHHASCVSQHCHMNILSSEITQWILTKRFIGYYIW